MKLSEIIDYLMLESGEYIVGDISAINFDRNRFWTLVKRTLAYYNKYNPITKYDQILVGFSPYLFPEPAPEWISRIYPVGVAANFSLFGLTSDVDTPIPVVYRYEKPHLWISNAATIECKSHYYRQVEITFCTDKDGPTNRIDDVEIHNLEIDDVNYFRLLTGNFLISLGRSRRAFTMNDFPVSMDSANLVAEGMQLKEEAEQLIIDQSKWWDSMGG